MPAILLKTSLVRTFSPARLRNLLVWLDAMDARTLDPDGSDIVTNWVNKGLAGDAVGVGANRPKYVVDALNGKPALFGRHNGSTPSQLVIPDSAALNYTRCAVYIVGQRAVDMGAEECFFAKYNSSGNKRELLMYVSGTDRLNGGASVDGTSGTLVLPSPTGTLPVGTPFLASLTYDGTNLTAKRTVSGSTTTASSALASIVASDAPIEIFSNTTGFATPFAGYISEAIMVGRKPTTVEDALINLYLSRKWLNTVPDYLMDSSGGYILDSSGDRIRTN